MWREGMAGRCGTCHHLSTYPPIASRPMGTYLFVLCLQLLVGVLELDECGVGLVEPATAVLQVAHQVPPLLLLHVYTEHQARICQLILAYRHEVNKNALLRI